MQMFGCSFDDFDTNLYGGSLKPNKEYRLLFIKVSCLRSRRQLVTAIYVACKSLFLGSQNVYVLLWRARMSNKINIYQKTPNAIRIVVIIMTAPLLTRKAVILCRIRLYEMKVELHMTQNIYIYWVGSWYIWAVPSTSTNESLEQLFEAD